ncbi:17406_t:CDS:2 [Funneliformis geosporum]|uniref:RING-type E3 ubiquitin transferase n=1 Tax=Funneliformis geosporum TaxID=1117311 RepID=A0A9W4SI57_9GLOM|nr:17406_t:CDS:2 [Funneliformis geosporum]CAI2169399.1 7181_t:CDS:2 [Funneliformis geosporum]
MFLRLFKRFFLLLLLVQCSQLYCDSTVVDATIVVVATNVTYQDRIAAFGPRLSDEGLFGYLVLVEDIEPDNKKGCSKLKNSIEVENQIVLVERGQCSFIEKVRNMQASGAIAVVVGDNERNGLITMYATGDTSDVKIPSVFVAQSEYRAIKSTIELSKQVEVQLVKDNLLQWPLLDVIIVVILSPTVMMIFIYVLWRIRQRQRRKQDIAPQQVVGNLATKIFFDSKRQENEPQECAICLEDYVDEDELRILPCKHEFHIVCIDSWLTTRKKFCPICKRDICTPTEETPLLTNNEPTP